MPRALCVDDSVDTCDCCGRTGLKRTVLMQLDDLSLVYYGTTCAARNTGKDQSQIKNEIAEEQMHNAGRASNEWRSTDECKALREFRIGAPWEKLGWEGYENSQIVRAANQKRSEIAAKYKVSTGSF